MKKRANLRSPLFLQYDAQAPIPASTNLFLRSSEYNLSPNTYTNATALANSPIPSPDGSTASENLTSTNNGALPKLTQQIISIPISTYTFSVYVKYKGSREVTLLAATNAPPYFVWLNATFDILDGTVVSSSIGDASIDSVGNGWYRLMVTGVSVVGGNNLFRTSLDQDTPINDGILIWGGQVEAQSYATPLIVTTTNPVGRAATTDYSNDEVTAELRIWDGSGGSEMDRENLVFPNTNLSGYGVNFGYKLDNNIESPNGLNNGSLVQSIGGGVCVIYKSFTTLVNTVHNMSVFLKRGNYDQIRIQEGYTYSSVIFNFSSGEVVSSTSATNIRVEDYNDGWYRVSFNYTSHASTALSQYSVYIDGSTALGNSFYTFGGQIEVNDSCTDLIETSTSAVAVNAYDDDAPADPTYTLVKDPINNKTTFEVSDLIRDYIEQTDINSSGNIWAKVSLFDGVQLPRHYTFLATEGYIDSSDSIQTHLNTYKLDALMQSNDTVIIAEGDSMSIPVYLKYPSYYNKVTSGVTTSNTYLSNLSENSKQIEYIEVTSDDTSLNLYKEGILVETININKAECSKFSNNKIMFVNRFGAKQELSVNMKSVESIRVKDSGFNRTVIDYSDLSMGNGIHGYKRSVMESKESFVLNTPFLDEGNVQAFEELLLSEYVWLKIGSNDYLPVTIKDNSMTRKTHINDKLIQYTVNVESSFNLINNQR